MNSFLKLKDVDYTYTSDSESIKAIENINIEIKEKEFICVIGPSGCGKSTLLKLIAGYLIPAEGSITLKGKKIEGPDRERGVMFQSPTLYPWLNVKENIEFGLKMRGIALKEREEISKNLVKEVELEGFYKTRSFDLSGGMKQRVQFARVLANTPNIILMDEPFGSLDALTRLKMQALVRRVWNERKSTVFMITHDIDEAICLATRIIVMNTKPGTIVEDIKVDYTFKALNDERGRVHLDQNYIELKEHLLDLIE